MNLFRTLKDLGYKFENSELRRIDSNEKYKFEDDCRDGYEKLCEAVISYVQEKLLMDTLKMRRIYLPDDSSAFVFGTKNPFKSTKKLLVLIHGAGKVQAGLWSRQLTLEESISSGTQIPYIKHATKSGYDVLVTNTNFNFRDKEGSPTAEQHADTVWHNVITPNFETIDSFAIVAHSYGGTVAISLMNKYPRHFREKCFGIGLSDSVHDVKHLSEDMREWFIGVRYFLQLARLDCFEYVAVCLFVKCLVQCSFPNSGVILISWDIIIQ